MNNGIFVQDIYGKPGFDNGLPRPLLGSPSVIPTPYHYPGGNWNINLNNLVLLIDTTKNSTTSVSFLMAGSPNNCSVDWGDGAIDTVYSSAGNVTYSHRYASHGIYIVQVATKTSDVGIRAPRFNGANYLIHIISFGNLTGAIGPDYLTAFQNCTNLIGVPNILPPQLTALGSTFNGCSSLNDSNISLWNTSNITHLGATFQNCTLFNQNIGSWDVSKVISFSSFLNGCTNFNNGGDDSIKNWNTSSANNMISMFRLCRRFNQPIGNWNLSNVTSTSSMFDNASSFNQPLNTWNTSNITDMSLMFLGHTDQSTGFNQDISSWNVNKVINFNAMFFTNFAFNNGNSPNINNWNINTANEVNMFRMFYDNKPFNQPLGNWNVSRVTNMGQMFPYAAFDQNISNWNIASVTNLTGMRQFFGGFSTANYDALLIGWNNNKLVSANGVANWNTTLTPNFGASKYTAGGSAASARAALVTYGWTITDGGTA